MHPFLLAVLSIVMSVAAQFSLKSGMSNLGVISALQKPASLSTATAIATQPYILLGFALYGLGAIVWLAVLAKWEVSKAYPLVGLGFAVSTIVGLVIGEEVTLQRAAGVAVICVGVWLVART